MSDICRVVCGNLSYNCTYVLSTASSSIEAERTLLLYLRVHSNSNNNNKTTFCNAYNYYNNPHKSLYKKNSDYCMQVNDNVCIICM